jgi:hypothetical protein
LTSFFFVSFSFFLESTYTKQAFHPRTYSAEGGGPGGGRGGGIA